MTIIDGDGIYGADVNSAAKFPKGIDQATLPDGYGLVPSGCVLPFAGTTAPTGYLLCDGTAVSRSTYAALFAAIGTAHGTGNGSTTFNLPDYRGRFLRGAANGQTTDPDKATRTAMATGGATGDNVGSVQDDAFQGHMHLISVRTSTNTAGNVSVSGNAGAAENAISGGDQTYATSPTYGTAKPSTETRPKNANVNYIIKF